MNTFGCNVYMAVVISLVALWPLALSNAYVDVATSICL